MNTSRNAECITEPAKGAHDVSLQVLQNLSLALAGSLAYMVVLVAYIKGSLGLTLDVHHEAVLTFWCFIIWLVFTILEGFDKRSPRSHINYLRGQL